MTADAYVPHRYNPARPEIGCIADAIRLFRQVIAAPQAPDVDKRSIVSYCEGVAIALADLTGEAADPILWSETAVLHPWHRSDRFALKRAWFEYIRTAAEHLEQEVADVA